MNLLTFPNLLSRPVGVRGAGGDTLAPTCVITASVSTVTVAAFTATFTFSEDVTGFVIGDITLSANAGASNFQTVSASVYTATITPTATGTVTIDVGAGVCTDLAGNANEAATQFSILYLAVNLWLRSTVGLFQDAGTTPATADADPVGQWTDQSPAGNNGTAAGTARPLLENAAGDLIGTLPVVQWFGTNDVLALGSNIVLNDYTTFFIGKIDAAFSGLWGNSATGNGIYRTSLATQLRFRYNNVSVSRDQTITANINLSTAYCLVISRSGTDTVIRLNGAQVGAFGAGDYASAGDAFTINRLGLVIGSYSLISVAEAGVIPAAVTGTPLAALEAYLSTRSGIPF